jgi:hypothetical protein
MMDWLTGVALAGAILVAGVVYGVIALIFKVHRRSSNKAESVPPRRIRLPERRRSF